MIHPANSVFVQLGGQHQYSELSYSAFSFGTTLFLIFVTLAVAWIVIDKGCLSQFLLLGGDNTCQTLPDFLSMRWLYSSYF